jgi:hypothetical protein
MMPLEDLENGMEGMAAGMVHQDVMTHPDAELAKEVMTFMVRPLPPPPFCP